MYRFLATIFSFAIVAGIYAQGDSLATYTDTRDNKVYPVVKIGSQTWFGENLKYAAKGSFCYGNNEKKCVNGRLYPKDIAETACPTGWKLPSNDDFQKLYGYAGETGVRSVGNALKAKDGWDRNGNGFDDFKFNAKPAGVCKTKKQCEYQDCFLSMWSSTDDISWSLYCIDEDFNKGTYPKTTALSVRCIKE